MTTLQEAAMREALEALERIGKDFVCRSAHHAKKDQHSAFAECPVVVRHTDAIKALNAALAQQELPQKERPDFMAGYDAGMTDAKRMAQQGEQQPVCHGCGIPAGDVHMSTCKSGKWPSRVSNGDTAAPAPQAQQGEPVYQYQMADGSWIDQIKDSYDYNRKYVHNATIRVVYTATPAPQAQGEPTGCACRWDEDDNRVATCARHQGWLDVVHEWAERAKVAEAAMQTAQPVAQDVAELVDALEKLARLGNGEHYGNSDGNMIARDALSKYKGAK